LFLPLLIISRLVFFLFPLLPPGSTLFPYTTLFRSIVVLLSRTSLPPNKKRLNLTQRPLYQSVSVCSWASFNSRDSDTSSATPIPDRKSTRLNSSHVKISYAVFCLKKKK